ncbi:uncharacterized protein LOC105839583 [Monomorium pharaonis]|uniref:uncharacterized protein LOC105839583 n=1 Tax=Monomorium pharaonis TaxID=307658 RepID=UPI00063F80FC|nr:uncharacterized protein LOC105839583 [Monomorium pharaonis]
MEFFDESESEADTVSPNRNVDADFIAANHGNVQLYQEKEHVKEFCDKLAAGLSTASDIVPSLDNDVNITIKTEEDNFMSVWLPESDFFTNDCDVVQNAVEMQGLQYIVCKL